jgi:AcrR family transcriptional regulator
VARRTRTRLEPEVRREQIVAAAERVYDGRDPSEITFEEVASAAGVSRALVYNYFGDKGGLLAAVYLRSSNRLDARLREALNSEGPRQERLRRVVGCYLRFAREHAGIWALIGTAEATTHPVVQRARRQRYERMAAAWGATPEGMILARGVVSFLEGATLEWLEAGCNDEEATADLMHTLLWGGIATVGARRVELPADRRPTITVS